MPSVTDPSLIPHNDAFKQSLQRGADAETLFRQAVHANGGRILAKASYSQDRVSHWDFKVAFGPDVFTVDVKAMKSLHRGQEPQCKYVCLELHGNAEYNKGWLFGGKADILAFQTDTGFILCRRKELCEQLPMYVSKERVSRSEEAIYKLYNRRDFELVTWVALEDLVRMNGVAAMVLKV